MLVEKNNRVSVWVGKLTIDELNAYAVEEDIGSEGPINKFAEHMGEYFYDAGLLGGNHVKEALPIDELLAPLAYSKSYRDAVVDVASRLGVRSVNCALALIRYELQVDEWPAESPLQFLGNFDLRRE